MSQPIPTVFYIAIFREDQNGPQHKVLTSISGLLRFEESVRKDEEDGYKRGPYDVFVVNVETLEVVRYDLAPLQALVPGSARKKAKGKKS